MSHMKMLVKKQMFHLPNGLLLSVLCFNSSYPILNKLQQLQIWEVKQNTWEHKRKPTCRSNMAEEPGPKTKILPRGKFSVLHTECLKVILRSLSTPLCFITFKYNFSPCHICTTLWKMLTCFLFFSEIFQ